jgi:uncharacterized membrane protein
MRQLIATAGTIILMDLVWLTLRNSYHQALFKSIQQSPIVPRILPAILVYGILITAVYVGAVQSTSSVSTGIARGAFVGAILYGFYDLTNYATLLKWTLQMTVTDIVWGVCLCAVAAGVGVYVKK